MSNPVKLPSISGGPAVSQSTVGPDKRKRREEEKKRGDVFSEPLTATVFEGASVVSSLPTGEGLHAVQSSQAPLKVPKDVPSVSPKRDSAAKGKVKALEGVEGKRGPAMGERFYIERNKQIDAIVNRAYH